MSRESMFFQLVHEYAHCWHYENQPEFLACNLYFREGFSEWMAYRALYVLGDTKQRARQLDNVLTEYSTGLKRFLALERKLGSRTAVLDYVKENTKL